MEEKDQTIMEIINSSVSVIQDQDVLRRNGYANKAFAAVMAEEALLSRIETAISQQAAGCGPAPDNWDQRIPAEFVPAIRNIVIDVALKILIPKR